ncbi:hypothetical protein ACHAXR_007799 [Thalassiosira sp. AJA248-18]
MQLSSVSSGGPFTEVGSSQGHNQTNNGGLMMQNNFNAAGPTSFPNSTSSPTPNGVVSSSAPLSNALEMSAPINISSGGGKAAGVVDIPSTQGATHTNIFHGKGSFPLNLTLMLESVERLNLSHVVSWLPSGKSFVIHDPDQFLTLVLPKFFKSSKNTKIRSFYRKLNRWGFSILRNHHLAKQGVGTMKGVWNHPDFFRTRAVECLKVALETGDTGCFLNVSHGKTDGTSPRTSEGGNEGPTSNKKSSSPFDSSSSSLRNSTGTESTYFGGLQPQHRASHRESDFSLGDDSVPDMNAHAEFLFSQALGGNAASAGGAAALYGSNNISNSFTAGCNPSSMHGAPNVASLMNNINQNNLNQRARRSVAYGADLSSPSMFQYQPITKSGATAANIQGRRGTGISASWTAGTTISQQDFDFPNPLPFNPNAGVQQGHAPMDNNQNIDMISELTSMGGQLPQAIMGGQLPQTMQSMPEEGQKQGDNEQPNKFRHEDFELASFFEKFADSLQKP